MSSHYSLIIYLSLHQISFGLFDEIFTIVWLQDLLATPMHEDSPGCKWIGAASSNTISSGTTYRAIWSPSKLIMGRTLHRAILLFFSFLFCRIFSFLFFRKLKKLEPTTHWIWKIYCWACCCRTKRHRSFFSFELRGSYFVCFVLTKVDWFWQKISDARAYNFNWDN